MTRNDWSVKRSSLAVTTLKPYAIVLTHATVATMNHKLKMYRYLSFQDRAFQAWSALAAWEATRARWAMDFLEALLLLLPTVDVVGRLTKEEEEEGGGRRGVRREPVAVSYIEPEGADMEDIEVEVFD